jgi:cell division protein FtsB
MDFQQKRTVRRIIYSKFTIFVLLVLVIVFSRSVWNIYKKEKFSRESLSVVERKYEDMSSRKKYLEGQIQKLNTEDGIEEEIRDKFSVKKEGEISVLIIDNSSSSKKIEMISEKSLWQKFLDVF